MAFAYGPAWTKAFYVFPDHWANSDYLNIFRGGWKAQKDVSAMGVSAFIDAVKQEIRAMTSATNKSPITELRSKLLKALKTAFGAETPGWRAQNFEILLEIEAILYLHHHILGCDRIDDVDQSWALVSGYLIPGLNDSADLRAKCLSFTNQAALY